MKIHASFWLYFSYILYNISMGLYNSFLPIHLRSLGASIFLISLLSAIPALIIVFLTPIWGMMSDQVKSRKLFIMVGMIANTVLFLTFIFLDMPIQFIVALGFFEIFICALQPNLEAFATQIIVQKGRAVGILMTSRSIGLALGAFIGGIIFEILGMQQNFILGFLISAFSILIIYNMKEEKIDESKNKKFFNLAPYQALLKNRTLIPVYVIAFLFSFGIVMFSSLFSIYFISIGGSKTLLGITNSIIFIIAIIVSTPAGILADKIGRKYLLIFGTIVCSLTTGLLYFTSDPLITAALWAFPLHPYISIASIAIIADHTTNHNRGAGIGLLIVVQSVARMIGPPIGGALAEYITIRGLIPLSTIILILGGLVAIFFIREKNV